MAFLPKILVTGEAEHGKDTVGEIMATYGFKCLASSSFATSRIMMPYFKSIGKPYPSEEACFEDRVNHRDVWYQQIEAYNAPSWNRVTTEMFQDGYDVYIGMRSEKEFHASKQLYDHVIWVDASKRLPPEDRSSNTMSPAMADYVIDNNGSLDDLTHHVGVLVNLLLLRKELEGTPDRNADVLIAQMFVGENDEFNLTHKNLRNRKSPCPEFTRNTDAIFKWLIPENTSLSIEIKRGEMSIVELRCYSTDSTYFRESHTLAVALLSTIVEYYLGKYVP